MINTLGATTNRVILKEEPHPIAQGFPISGSNVIGDFAVNMEVKLNNDGTVSPVAATTDRPLGRICSVYQGTDSGVVRVITPFEAILRCKANGTLDEGQQVACSGFDATAGVPIYKAATTNDWVSGICLTGGATTTTECAVGVLRVPYAF